MDWVFGAIAVVVLAVAAVALWARLLPVHILSRRARDLTAPAELVWHVLTDFEAYPRWRRRVHSTSRVPSPPQEELWRESYGRMGLTLRTEVVEPGRVLCRHVVGRKLEFGGEWRFELESRGSTSRLSITEMAEYYRPMHRLVARTLEGEGRNIEAFLADLERELGRQDQNLARR